MTPRMRNYGFAAGFASAFALLLVVAATDRGSVPDAGIARVAHGALTVWTSHPGRFEARNEVRIVAAVGGIAALIDLVPEGTRVERGQLIARFESSRLELEALRLEEEFAAAQAEYDGLVNARHPLELQTLEADLLAAERELDGERRFLVESRGMASDGLISDSEVDDQAARVTELELRHTMASRRLQLTEAHLHPAEIRRARARLASAEQALDIARRNLAAATVLAPAAGVVIYPPIPIGSEFRSVRIGDGVVANQVFATLPDFSALVVECEIPEAELAQVAPGTRAAVRPLAHPQLEVPGRVIAVGPSGHTVPGQPAWQRYFKVRIELDVQEPRLRPGMTALVSLLAYHADDVLLVPRNAVSWSGGDPFVTVAARPFDERRRIVVGRGDLTHFEVLEGLTERERVRMQ